MLCFFAMSKLLNSLRIYVLFEYGLHGLQNLWLFVHMVLMSVVFVKLLCYVSHVIFGCVKYAES